jgi:hypothetical protein
MPKRALLALFALTFVTPLETAHALPAFARRFNLACGACHSAVPRLNAFGEAFHMNGFKPPGTMWTPLPGSLPEALTQGMAVWTRGEFFERSEFAHGPDPRMAFSLPEHASLYVAGALTPSTSVFMEAENTVHETDINRRGDFVNSDTGGLQKAFLMIDLPMLLGLHHHDMAGMDHAGHDMADMEMGMATMGEGLIGHGPMMMIGRVDPSTNFSYAVDRQLFHDVPADTDERGFLLRLALNPYAFGAKFFGIFKRGDHTLLPTEPTLYHAEAAPGVDLHGRLFASHLLYQLGVTTDAAPEFLDRFHTTVPYAMLRWDFGDDDGLNGSVSVLGNYGRNAYRVFYLAPAPLPTIPLAVSAARFPGIPVDPDPLHRPPPPPGRGTIVAQRDLDVWREGIGANLRRGPWDAYGAYTYDQVSDVPATLAGRFVRRAQGLTAEIDYRLTHSLVPSLRYDWMKAGGFKSDVIFEPGPRESQVLHLQLRWYVFEGDDLAKVPIPALLALSVRDSVNLTPGGTHPFGAWRNGVFLGFDFAF